MDDEEPPVAIKKVPEFTVELLMEMLKVRLAAELTSRSTSPSVMFVETFASVCSRRAGPVPHDIGATNRNVITRIMPATLFINTPLRKLFTVIPLIL